MTFRPDILAGRAVILVSIQDTVDKQLRIIRNRLRSFANLTSELGGDLFRFGAVGTAAAFFPVKDFMQFQDQLLFLQTKLQVTDKDMMGLEVTIRDLGKSTSFTSIEVAKAATELAKAGFSLQEVKDTLQASLDLARGGQVDLSTATAILANNIRTFGVNTNQASVFASKFITAARLGTLDIVDLNESLKESSGTFRLLGIDIDNALALITQLSLSSLRATKAGTSLNTAFINLARRADDVNKLIGGGFILQDEDLSQPLSILSKMAAVLSTMSKIEQVSILNQLSNIRGGRAISSIIIQGLQRQQHLLHQITKSSNEARISAAKLDSRLGGVFRRGLSAFQELLLSIGSTSEGPLTKFGESLRTAFNELSLLSQKNPELLQSLLLLPPVTLAAGAALLTLSFALGKIATIITPLITLNRVLFSFLARIVGINRGIAVLSGKGLASLFTLFSKSKVGGASFDFSRGLLSGFKGLKNIGATLHTILIANRAKVHAKVAAAFTKIFAQGGALFAGARKHLAAGFMAVFNGRRGIFSAFNVKPIVNALRTFSTTVFKLYATSLNSLFKKGGTFLSSGVNYAALYKSITRVPLLTKTVSGFKSLFTALRGVFAILNGIRRLVTSLGPLGILEMFILFGDKLPGVSRALEIMGNGFKKFGQGLKETITATGPAFKTLSLGFGSLFTGNLGEGISILKVGFSDLGNIIKEGVAKAWMDFVVTIKPVSDRLKALFEGLLQTFNAIYQVIRSIFTLSGRLLTSGDGSATKSLADATSPDSLKVFFAGIEAIIKEIGIAILKTISYLAEAIGLLKQTLLGMLKVLSLVPGSGVTAPDERQKQIADRLAFLKIASGLDTPEAIALGNEYIALGKKLNEQGSIVDALNKTIAELEASLAQNTNNAAGRPGLSHRGGANFARAQEEAQRNARGIVQVQALKGFTERLMKPYMTAATPLFDAATSIINGGKSLLEDVNMSAEELKTNLSEVWKEANKLLGAKSLDKASSAFSSFNDALANLWNPLLNLLPAVPPPPLPPGIAEDMRNLKTVTASIVGSFSSTRGQLLKQLGENRDKERNELLKDIKDGVNGIAENGLAI